MLQQEFIKKYWKPGDKVIVDSVANSESFPAVVESESVVDPGWVYVREPAAGGRRGALHRVQAALLRVRDV